MNKADKQRAMTGEKCFNGCSVKTGQVINKRRQAKKELSRELGVTGKRLRQIERKIRRDNLIK